MIAHGRLIQMNEIFHRNLVHFFSAFCITKLVYTHTKRQRQHQGPLECIVTLENLPLPFLSITIDLPLTLPLALGVGIP